MTLQESKKNWIIKHLRRQAVLAWLLDHGLITGQIAEKIDDIDNSLRRKKTGEQQNEKYENI